MLSLVVLLAVFVSSYKAALIRCDFETPCVDFTIDNNWGVTDGLHPQSIDHDHTLNTSSGHYLFYQPQNRTQILMAEIQTTVWMPASTDRAVCFSLWYYTLRITCLFTIQLVQGDDEQLTRVVATIPGKDPSTNDWAQIHITLPTEKVKVFIRLNDTRGPLVFDDLSVDFCDGPRPLPPKILFACDFESSCSDILHSLPYYPYQWSAIQASEAVKQENQAPAVDYTFSNGSGHYTWLANYGKTEKGYVGYLATRAIFDITANETYCLSFQYYGYERYLNANLKVYLWMSNTSDVVQVLWPPQSSSEFTYTSNKWTWGIVNLPVGHYSLLFRVASTYYRPRSFAVDNIIITSCAYPPSQLSPNNSLLSFSCDFDKLNMCGMENGDGVSPASFNFTVFTGDTVPNRELGPTRDHTTNSSSGAFIYWNRQLPFAIEDHGAVRPSSTVEENLGMCVRFAYYVKSLAATKNRTILTMEARGCYAASLWELLLDDSYGWQVATIPVANFACSTTFYLSVQQTELVEVSVAFDDVEIVQCSSFNSTTNGILSTSDRY